MAAPAVIRTDLDDLFEAIIDRLVAKAVVSEEAAVIVCATDPADSENVPHYRADKDVCIWPGDEASDGNDVGAGRHDTRSVLRFYVVCRSRVALDEAGRDRQRLMHASLGHFAFRKDTRDALHIFWPEDADRNALGVQPLHWKRTGAPKPDRKDRNWVSSAIEMECVYSLDIDQADQ